MQNGWLTDKESEAVSYVRIVERLYEAHDYDHFVSTHNQIEDTESSVSPPSWYKCGTVKPFSGFQLKFVSCVALLMLQVVSKFVISCLADIIYFN